MKPGLSVEMTFFVINFCLYHNHSYFEIYHNHNLLLNVSCDPLCKAELGSECDPNVFVALPKKTLGILKYITHDDLLFDLADHWRTLSMTVQSKASLLVL